MSLLDILRWPDARLSQPCAAVAEITPEIARLAEDMLETMYAAPGRGLAAPQVGVLSRLFVMDTAWKEGTPAPMVFLNPERVSAGETLETRAEGCLSLPGVTVEVTRPETVTLRWTDLSGGRHEGAFTGFAATCVQHEMDHLDGVMTLDHLAPEARDAVLAGYREAAQA